MPYFHSLQLFVWKEGLALYLIIGCVLLRVTPKLFWGEGRQSDIFEKIVEKESESVKANILEFLPVNTIYLKYDSEQ